MIAITMSKGTRIAQRCATSTSKSLPLFSTSPFGRRPCTLRKRRPLEPHHTTTAAAELEQRWLRTCLQPESIFLILLWGAGARFLPVVF
jgi:hypothetical protein